MTDWPSVRPSRLLLVALALLAAVVVAVLGAGYLSAQRHVERLEAELRGLYAREAELQTRVEQQEQRIRGLTAERDAAIERSRKKPPRRPLPPATRRPAARRTAR